MINQKTVLAIIPARGGSKGIPHKNIADLNHKPLIAYTIEAAKNSCYIDRVIISTDDLLIAGTAKEFGGEVPFMRPKELASDKAKTIDAILFTITQMELTGSTYDLLVLLQPTSPLRTSEDIDRALEEWMDSQKESMLSISPVTDSPVLIRQRTEKGELVPVLSQRSDIRRQDMPQYYRVNGAIYGNAIHKLTKETSFNDNQYGYVMEKNHAIDIDEQLDLELVRLMMQKTN